MFWLKLLSTSILYELYIHVLYESSDSSREFAHVPEPLFLVDDVHVSAEISYTGQCDYYTVIDQK